MLHIAERFLIHLFASGGAVLAVLFALRYFLRRVPTPWLPQTIPQQIVFAAVCVFAASALREAWDMAHGQSLLKAGTDHLSWAIGLTGTAWGLIRVWRNKL